MSSLTDAALFSKKAFFWGIIAIAVVIALMIFMGIGGSIKKAFFPPPPTPATVAFGKLPSQIFTEGYKPNTQVTYELQTISGGFGDLPTFAKVFAVIMPDASFGAAENITDRARSLGFEEKPIEVKSGQFEFSNPDEKGKTLTVDSVSGNFTLETEYVDNPDVISEHPESEEAAIEVATDFFDQYDLDLSDYPAEKITTRKLRIDGGKLTETQSLSSANVVEVNFNRDALDNVPVFWSKENGAGITAIVSGQDVVYAKVLKSPIAKSKFATYPLRHPAEAFEDLKKGNAFFNKPVTSGRATIIDVTLAYVEGENTRDYLQPVYLFKSSDDLLGFVSAIDPNWVGK